MNQTKIEWIEATWKPSIGCDKVSAGCKNCYAEKMAEIQCKMQNAECKIGSIVE